MKLRFCLPQLKLKNTSGGIIPELNLEGFLYFWDTYDLSKKLTFFKKKIGCIFDLSESFGGCRPRTPAPFGCIARGVIARWVSTLLLRKHIYVC